MTDFVTLVCYLKFMSLRKAQDIIRLAQLASYRRRGITLDDIREEFGVSHRTAQRMAEALMDTFANVTFEEGDDRRRRWRIADPLINRLQLNPDIAIEALEMALRDAHSQSRQRHAKALSDIKEQIVSTLKPQQVLRTEVDVEAIMAGLGQVTKPGPKVNFVPEVLNAIIEALRGPFQLRVRYKGPDEAFRVLEPHGLLLGHRSYLVARQPSRDQTILNFRMDRILSAECLDESFVLSKDFSLNEHGAKAFGVFQDPDQYGEVIWLFKPEAATRAAEFIFHPTQIVEPQPDGSLIVKFHASGWLEMAWHLYQWGDKVEVIAPEELKTLVSGHQRNDFDALP